MPRLHRSSSRCTFVNQRTDRANAHPMSRASCGHHSHQPVKEPRGHGFTFSRHECPSDARNVPSKKSRAQGMPDAGRTHGPPATRNAGGSHHRQGRDNRHSLRDGFTAYSGLSPETGLCCLRRLPLTACRARGGRHRQSIGLTPASGGQDHTPLPSARMLSSARQARLSILTSTASRALRP